MTQTTDSFEFSLDLKATPSPETSPPQARWIAPPFRAHPINAEAALVHIEDDYPPKRLNLQLVQVLSLCDELRTLEQHCKHILERMNLTPEHAQAVREALNHLKDQFLLMNEDQVLTKLANQRRSLAPPPPLAHVFIRTADRPAALKRLLHDLEAKANGSQACVWVLDDSRIEASIQANAEASNALAKVWPGAVRYIDPAKRKDWLGHIASGAKVDADQLNWLVEGAPDDASPSYGAGLNLALLLAAGQRFCIIDDDATLEPHVLEDAHFGVDLRPKRQQRLVGIDPNSAETSQFPKGRVDALAAHSQWLGRSLTDIVTEMGALHPNFLSQLNAQLLHQLKGSPSIRLTTNGSLGDPGTTSMTWLFSQPASDWHAFCHQDPAWAGRLFNRRFARVSSGTQITTDFSLMTTTMTGIDNRELLLPTVAKGRNEDLLFAALMHFLYPDALSADLPFMLPHRPEEPRRWQDQDLDPRRPFHEKYSHMMILADLIESLQLPKGDPRSRLSYLTAWLTHFAKLDQAAALEIIMADIIELQAQQVAAINETASRLETPDWLKVLFERVIGDVLDDDDHFVEHAPKITTPIQHFAGQYAAAISTWVEAWRWCCQHDLSRNQL